MPYRDDFSASKAKRWGRGACAWCRHALELDLDAATNTCTRCGAQVATAFAIKSSPMVARRADAKPSPPAVACRAETAKPPTIALAVIESRKTAIALFAAILPIAFVASVAPPPVKIVLAMITWGLMFGLQRQMRRRS